MKRLLLAILFFVGLLLLWEGLVRAKIWSPVLLPAPAQVAAYLKSATMDGTLAHATVITMRRLLIGYFVGLILGLPLGLLTARWNLFRDTIGTMALGSANVAERLLGPARASVVRPNGSRHALRRRHGNALVGHHRHRDRRAQRPADLSPRRAHHGIKAFAHVVESDFAGRAAVHRQRHETRLGLCLALAHGRGNFRYHPDRLRAWASFCIMAAN